ncbi:MAG TPA: coniferyl aldehyde dehydrogenase [Pseudomonadales bacterium]|nr:coniferyl aldehyde dehydrogenase [Pseudomonadales bacterium]
MDATVADIRAKQSPEIAEMNRVFQLQKEAFRKKPYPSADERIVNLQKFKQVLVRYQDELAQAACDDFGHRSLDETKIAEIAACLEGTKYYSKNLRSWMKPQKRHVSPMAQPAKARVLYQPLGVVGVIVPWNYPIFLAVGPLLCALAAGNRVMIKMSGFTPRTGEVLKKMLAEAYSEDLVAVVTGRGEISDAFSRLPFDQLTFTGSTNVGRTVMANAAVNLVPVLLELGGKSPAIIHESFPMADAAIRIAWGKCWNAGQTCTAPDYLFCPKGKVEEFVAEFTKIVGTLYPSMLNNPDYTSVVNAKQYTRLQGYLRDAREKGARIIEINPGNERFENTHKMPVTMVLDVTDDMEIMKNEIFGPVLAVKTYERIEEALNYITERDRPLALYYFDYDSSRADYIIKNTHSGGMCINDTVSHGAIDDLPFGGVGASGMGKYHGFEGFTTMSNAKAILEKPKFYAIKFILPPFNKPLHNIIKKYVLK